MDAFGGQPVWLASYSWRDTRGYILATDTWTDRRQEKAGAVLLRAMEGIGDPNRQRLFRMNITLCLHRGVTPAEEAGLPKDWATALGGMAGGPIELLWSKGVPDLPAGRPCANPGKDVIIPERPDLWFPRDCGQCEPCQARAAIEARLLQG